MGKPRAGRITQRRAFPRMSLLLVGCALALVFAGLILVLRPLGRGHQFDASDSQLATPPSSTVQGSVRTISVSGLSFEVPSYLPVREGGGSGAANLFCESRSSTSPGVWVFRSDPRGLGCPPESPVHGGGVKVIVLAGDWAGVKDFPNFEEVQLGSGRLYTSFHPDERTADVVALDVGAQGIVRFSIRFAEESQDTVTAILRSIRPVKPGS